jgi:hypothetical protein
MSGQGSGAAVAATFADRLLCPRLPTSPCTATNRRSGPQAAMKPPSVGLGNWSKFPIASCQRDVPVFCGI